MRTTLTLDDDVSAGLDALRQARGLSLKDAVNETLRRGLRAASEPDQPRPAFVTKSFHMGTPYVSLDNVAEALAWAEGEDFR